MRENRRIGVMAKGCFITYLVTASTAFSQDDGSKAVAETVSGSVLRCLVENASWLSTLPDDPITFFFDLCPTEADTLQIDDAVRVENPDIEPRAALNGTQPVEVRSIQLSKASLNCLGGAVDIISAAQVAIETKESIVTSLTTTDLRLVLDTCEMEPNVK